MWIVQTTPEYDEWFASVDETVQIALYQKIALLQAFGPALPRPHADTLGGSRHSNMKELRARTATAEIRVAFAFDPERQAILLCAGNKAGVGQRQFYTRLIDRADRLFDEHLARLAARRKKKKGK
jgi:hypothetical protein